MRPEHQKNLEIEVLRGVAITMVMWNHLVDFFSWGGAPDPWIWKWLPAWSGVDLFFCISGYVVMQSMMRIVGSSNGTFLSICIPFWVRRVWRLLPSAWFWLLVTIVLSVVYNVSGAFVGLNQNLGDALSIVFQVSNFHFLGCIHDSKLQCGANWQYWSLSLEEQFYVVFPFFIFFVPARWRAWVLGALVMGQLLLNRPPFSLGWAIRTDAICLGVLIAMAQARKSYAFVEPIFLRSRPLAVIASLAAVCLLAALPTPKIFIVPFVTGLVAIVSAMLVFAASFDKGYVLAIPGFKQVMVWIGSRSYAIYLTHYVAYHLVIEFWVRNRPADTAFPGEYSLPMSLAAIPLALILAELNYRFIETPGIRHGKAVAQRITARLNTRFGAYPTEAKSRANV